MKKVQLILFAFMALFAFSSDLHAQCDPDTSLDIVGVYPDTFPQATVGQYYEHVLHLVLPKDTLFSGLTLQFCSFSVDSISPALDSIGMSYECNVPNCEIFIDHTDTVINRGCAIISGTPTQTLDSVTVYVTAVLGTYDPVADTCNSAGVSFPIGYTFPFSILATSIDDLALSDLNLSLYPNPTSASSTLEFELPEAADVNIGLYDMFGRRVRDVFRGYRPAGSYSDRISGAGLSSGIYMVRIDLDEGANVFTQKLLME